LLSRLQPGSIRQHFKHAHQVHARAGTR
jgi:hypothetical protein